MTSLQNNHVKLKLTSGHISTNSSSDDDDDDDDDEDKHNISVCDALWDNNTWRTAAKLWMKSNWIID